MSADVVYTEEYVIGVAGRFYIGEAFIEGVRGEGGVEFNAHLISQSKRYDVCSGAANVSDARNSVEGYLQAITQSRRINLPSEWGSGPGWLEQFCIKPSPRPSNDDVSRMVS